MCSKCDVFENIRESLFFKIYFGGGRYIVLIVTVFKCAFMSFMLSYKVCGGGNYV